MRLNWHAWLCLAMLTFGPEVGAQQSQGLPNPALRTFISSSGQFITSAPEALFALPPTESSTNSTIVEVVPQTLAVSCERIKQALLIELNSADVWLGRIHVHINLQLTNNAPALIGAKPYLDGWQYRIEIPRRMDRMKLVRGIVHALLLEYANRTASVQRSAEIPLWLSEGLTQHLVHTRLADLVLPRPYKTVNRVQILTQTRRTIAPDPLADAREVLRSHAAFSFGEMGMASGEGLSEERWASLQASAQLFVAEMLQLDRARLQLVDMLLKLPHYLNSQLAFLDAFHTRWPTMLSVEKWWSVVLVHFTGFDTAHAWSIKTAQRKLDEILVPSIIVNDGEDGLPRRTRLSLQELLRDWDYLRYRSVLMNIQTQLLTQRIHLPIELIAIADRYVEVLDQYVTQRERTPRTPSLPGLRDVRVKRLLESTVEELDALDKARKNVGAEKTSDPSDTTP